MPSSFLNPARHAFSRALRAMEAREIAAAREPASPQIFITGLPRSGTTLASQYAAHRFSLAYFTRAVGDRPWAASTLTRWQRLLHRRYSSDFASQLGKSRGPVAPREAGAFWGMHFGYHDYVTPGDVGAAARETVRRTVWRVQNHAHDAPFMNKNVKHLLRLAALLDLFPRAAFLIVERDLAEIALSLLDVRRELSPDLGRWFSLRPPSYPELAAAPPLEQIARQVVDVSARMEEDLAAIPKPRVARLPYMEFCQNPEILAAIIRRWHPAIETSRDASPGFGHRRRAPRDPEERRLVERVRELASELPPHRAGAQNLSIGENG
jgi:hypothetical protein